MNSHTSAQMYVWAPAIVQPGNVCQENRAGSGRPCVWLLDLVGEVLAAPVADRLDDGPERGTVLGQRVLCLGRHDGVHLAVHQAVGLQLAKLLGEHLGVACGR